tara:strand:+ start:33379 stop:33711 length:333 start_codon:yes stop_codon:yes gene_type:complete
VPCIVGDCGITDVDCNALNTNCLAATRLPNTEYELRAHSLDGASEDLEGILKRHRENNRLHVKAVDRRALQFVRELLRGIYAVLSKSFEATYEYCLTHFHLHYEHLPRHT